MQPKVSKQRRSFRGFFWVTVSLLWGRPPEAAFHYFLATLNFSGFAPVGPLAHTNPDVSQLFIVDLVLFVHGHLCHLFWQLVWDSPTQSYAPHYNYPNRLACNISCDPSFWKFFLTFSTYAHTCLSQPHNLYMNWCLCRKCIFVQNTITQ